MHTHWGPFWMWARSSVVLSQPAQPPFNPAPRPVGLAVRLPLLSHGDRHVIGLRGDALVRGLSTHFFAPRGGGPHTRTRARAALPCVARGAKAASCCLAQHTRYDGGVQLRWGPPPSFAGPICIRAKFWRRVRLAAAVTVGSDAQTHTQPGTGAAWLPLSAADSRWTTPATTWRMRVRASLRGRALHGRACQVVVAARCVCITAESLGVRASMACTPGLRSLGILFGRGDSARGLPALLDHRSGDATVNIWNLRHTRARLLAVRLHSRAHRPAQAMWL
jgi:hypothetical protein